MVEPIIHETRNEALKVRFTDKHAMIDLADGRILGVPLNFFLYLKQQLTRSAKTTNCTA